MIRNISFMQYMRAHGNTPGPTHRPYLTGAISGLVAEVPSAALLIWSGAMASLARFLLTDLPIAVAFDTVVMVIAGIIYAMIFKRAANDRDGGWLFGISYGFLLWMFSPVTLWQLVSSSPIIIGKAAMGLFGAQVLYGLVLGFTYPRVHALVQSKLNQQGGTSP